MNEPRRELKEELGNVLRAEAGDPDVHPSADELAAYHAGELQAAEDARFQAHLAVCEECTELLLDLDAFENDPDFGAERPAPAAEVDAVWEAIQARANAPAAPIRSAAPPSLRDHPRRGGQARWLQAVAAGLLVGVIGLSLWVARLQTTVGELTQPQLNAPVQELAPSGSRGGDSGPPALRLPAGTTLFTLVLNPADRKDFPDYGAEIERQDGGILWSGRGLEKNTFGSFSLALPRALAPDGTYRIHLYGLEGERREPLGEYALVITTF